MLKLIADTANSIDDFARYRQPWNQLWDQSNAYEPLSRCEGIELWCRQFATDEKFSAIMVWNGDQLVGGLPLIHSQKSGVKLLKQPCNEWVNAGELLIHQDVQVEQVVSCIVEKLKTYSESILCFDGIRFESEAWSSFVEQIQATSGQTGILRKESVGLIEVGDSWDDYFQSLSGNHRSTVRRAEKKARKSGTVSLLRLDNLAADQCETWMRQAFEIENRSWKRENGSSILASDGMARFYLDEAEIARQAGLLELWFLLLDEKPIAFEYCHRAKQTCLSYKIGYDEAYKHLAPGKLLRKLQLETLQQQSPGTVLDTKGILCPTKAKWATSTYPIGRLIATVRGRVPKLILNTYLQARPIIQKLRNVDDLPPAIGLRGANVIN